MLPLNYKWLATGYITDTNCHLFVLELWEGKKGKQLAELIMAAAFSEVGEDKSSNGDKRNWWP